MPGLIKGPLKPNNIRVCTKTRELARKRKTFAVEANKLRTTVNNGEHKWIEKRNKERRLEARIFVISTLLESRLHKSKCFEAQSSFSLQSRLEAQSSFATRLSFPLRLFVNFLAISFIHVHTILTLIGWEISFAKSLLRWMKFSNLKLCRALNGVSRHLGQR